MEFTLYGPFRENIYGIIRKIGYVYRGENATTNEMSFTRGDGYPRFHVYMKKDGVNLLFHLHLDQKRPIYEGTTAHSGEYDGETVEVEADRIRKIVEGLKVPPRPKTDSDW